MASNNRLQLRLAAVPGLEGKCTLLDVNQFERIDGRLHQVYLTNRNELKPRLQAVARQIDLSDADNREVKQALFALGVPADEPSQLVWVADRAAATMAFRDFVHHYDDLWYPARDDLWVTDLAMTWLLELNHEEVLTFVRSDTEA